MIAAISQSNYIPWKGFFDMIACCGRICYCMMKCSIPKGIGEIRNLIKTPHGLKLAYYSSRSEWQILSEN
jgi:hypothetical protein